MSKAATFLQLGRQLANLLEEDSVQLITDSDSGDQIIIISARSAAPKTTKAHRIVAGFLEVTE